MEHLDTAALDAGLGHIREAPSDRGTVDMVVRRPGVEEREILEVGNLDPEVGLVGDNWAERPSSRTPDNSPHPDMQLNVMSSRVVDLVSGGRDRWHLAGDQLFLDLDLSESKSLRADLAIDALEMAVAIRGRTDSLHGLVHHSDRGVQYLCVRYSERLADNDIVASVGSKGDSYDNALVESFNGLYKWELIYPRGPWSGLQDVEFATLTYVDWFNNRRLHGQITPGPGYTTPVRIRSRLLHSECPHHQGGDSNKRASMKPGAIHPVVASAGSAQQNPSWYCLIDRLSVKGQRKVCGLWGCNWHTQSSVQNDGHRTFWSGTAYYACESGTHRYRTRTQADYHYLTWIAGILTSLPEKQLYDSPIQPQFACK